MNFEYFQIQNWMLQTVRVEKVDGKNGAICPLSTFFPLLKLSEKCIFWNFVLTLARKLSLLRQFTYMHRKGLNRYFQKIVFFYALTYCFGDIRVKRKKNLLDFCCFSIFFHIIVADISWKMAQNPINHIIFWKSIMRTFRFIYVYWFNRIRLLAEVSTKLQKNGLFWKI